MPREVRKIKLLTLMQVLFEKTDQLHWLSKKQIIDELAARDVEAERKSIDRDFEVLRDFGIDVVGRREGRSMTYSIANRKFTFEQLIWLVDAVQSCPSLTEEMTDELIERVKSLGSESQRKKLEKRVDVPGRVKMRNDSVLDNLDMLQQCMRRERTARFKYFDYDASGKRSYKFGGMTYEHTPVRLVYTDGFYYLVVWDDKYEHFASYRVDRMTDIEVGEKEATVNREILDYVPNEKEPVGFGMWGSKLTGVTMVVDEATVTMVKDKFGDSVTYTDIGDGKCRVHGKVAVGPVFYGWVAMFNKRMKITKPKSVVEGYKQYLRDCMEPYEE